MNARVGGEGHQGKHGRRGGMTAGVEEGMREDSCLHHPPCLANTHAFVNDYSLNKIPRLQTRHYLCSNVINP